MRQDSNDRNLIEIAYADLDKLPEYPSIEQSTDAVKKMLEDTADLIAGVTVKGPASIGAYDGLVLAALVRSQSTIVGFLAMIAQRNKLRAQPMRRASSVSPCGFCSGLEPRFNSRYRASPRIFSADGHSKVRAARPRVRGRPPPRSGLAHKKCDRAIARSRLGSFLPQEIELPNGFLRSVSKESTTSDRPFAACPSRTSTACGEVPEPPDRAVCETSIR